MVDINMAMSTFYVQSEQKTVTMQQMLNSYYFNDFFRAYDKTGFCFCPLKNVIIWFYFIRCDQTDSTTEK